MASSTSKRSDIIKATIESSSIYDCRILTSDEEEKRLPPLDLGTIEPYMYEPVANDSDTESDLKHKTLEASTNAVA